MKTFPLPWPNSSYDCGRSLSSGKTPLADAMVRAHDEGSKSRQSISCDLRGVASGSAVAREHRAAGCRRACGLVISDGATASLTITTQGSCSNTGGSATFSNGLLLPIIFFFGICSRRKRLRALLFAACVFLVGSGCAGQKVTCFTPAGSYTITVTGTSKVGTTTLTQTTTIAFTVGANGAIGGAASQ
jgi:hypothetical protein